MSHGTTKDWDPGTYARFRDLRLRPALDLMAQIGAVPEGPVVDLGCGDGAVAAALAARFPGHPLIGVDSSRAMLADAGATHVILGHSERRADHGEGNAEVAAKVRAAWAQGLIAVVCLGETEGQRDAGETLAVIGAQLAGSLPDGATADNTVIAYEPVWAIGTGRTPDGGQIAEVHAFLRKNAPDPAMMLLYGGSVNPTNASDIFAIADVDGALVGGASLKAADFGQIVTALEQA